MKAFGTNSLRVKKGASPEKGQQHKGKKGLNSTRGERALEGAPLAGFHRTLFDWERGPRARENERLRKMNVSCLQIPREVPMEKMQGGAVGLNK